MNSVKQFENKHDLNFLFSH